MSISYQAGLAPAPAGQRIVPAAIRFVTGWWRTYTGWRDRRRAIAALHRLDDRLLQDIGIERDRIETAVLTGRPDGLRVHREPFGWL